MRGFGLSVRFDQAKGSAVAGASGTVTAAGTFGAIAATARLPAPTMLPTAATVRKRRRVVSTGVFVGGMLSMRSAWIIGLRAFWFGLEPRRKTEALPLGLLL
jgi:hypothetical protein